MHRYVSGNNIKKLSKDDILTHINAYFDGKLRRVITGQPIPPKSNSPL
jgi:hypothetical protein